MNTPASTDACAPRRCASVKERKFCECSKAKNTALEISRVHGTRSGAFCWPAADPKALRAWYERAFDVHPDPDGFLPFGRVDLLITARDDVAPINPEPGRVIINIHVDDAQATALHLSAIGARWLAQLEYRRPDGA
jgi:hypothetical protein